MKDGVAYIPAFTFRCYVSFQIVSRCSRYCRYCLVAPRHLFPKHMSEYLFFKSMVILLCTLHPYFTPMMLKSWTYFQILCISYYSIAQAALHL